MTTRTTILVLAGVLAAAPLAAQGRVSPRLAQSQPPKYTPPLCPIKPNNAKVDKGQSLLRKAYDAKTPAEKAATLTEARTTLVSAITQESQGTNGAAWYYLARVALLRGDPVEADSAFTKTQDLVPLCEIDITQYRQNSWANLANAALEFQKKGEIDSAMVLFHDASFMFRALPHVYANMGVVFANSGHEDSAAVYFAKALAIAEKDTSLVEDRNGAAMNLAIMLQRQNKNTEAIAVFRKYLAWKPNDTDAQKSLAVAFRNAGMADSAQAMEIKMVDQFSKTNLDSLDLQDLMAVGVAAFNNQKYPEAETAFLKAVKRNPYSRDAQYNLANAYFAEKNYEKLIEHSSKLLEIEPMNEDALRLLAQGQRNLKQDDAVLKTAERLVALPFTVDVSGFQMGQNAAKLSLVATGRSPMDAAGKALKTAPVTLLVEFLDVNGTVIDSKETTVPVLAKDATHPIQLDAKGQGIAGWRYKTKTG